MREKMVTRTVAQTRISMVGLNLETMKPETTLEYLPVEERDDAKLLKLAHKLFDTDTFKVVTVQFDGLKETLYGVPEAKFLQIAVELDPETRKPLYRD